MKHSLLRFAVGGISVAALSAVGQAQIQFNEIYASHSGTDFFEFIELKGPANASLDNLVVCIVEGEGSLTNQGTLDRVWDLTGFSIPSDGYFVLGLSGVVGSEYTIVGAGNMGASDAIENGTETFYLIDAGSGSNVLAIQALLGTDVDADNDGITDLVGLGTFLDLVGMADGGINTATPLDTIFDGATVLGPDGSSFLPAGIFRGLDAPNPWCPEFLDFNEPGNQFQPRTPGALNSPCPSAVSIVSYCTAGTTTNGCTATMAGSGVPSIAATSGFTVSCTGIEGQKQGLIFYSLTGRSSLQWGTSSSFLCIKSPTQRTGAVNTGGTTNACDGTISIDFLAYLAANPGSLGGPSSSLPLAPGNLVNFQCWFRDPPSPKTTMLSDGLEVQMIP